MKQIATLFCLCLLLSCSDKTQTTISVKALEAIQTTLEADNKFIAFNTEFLEKRTFALLEKHCQRNSKATRQLLKDIRDAYAPISDYYNQIKWERPNTVHLLIIERLQEKIDNSREVIIDKFERYLNEESSNLDLKEEEIVAHLEELARILAPLKLDRFTELPNEKAKVKKHERLLIFNKIKVVEYELLSQASLFIRVPCFAFERYYPVVMNAKGMYKKGQLDTLRIGMTDFYSCLDEDICTLTINGDTVDVDRSDAYYVLPTNKLGDHKLELDLNYKMHRDGHDTKSSTVYEYRVYE